MPQLDITTYSAQLFWLVVCMVFLFMGLRFWILPRLDKHLLHRQTVLNTYQDEVSRLKEEISSLEEEIKEIEISYQKDLRNSIHQQTLKLETKRHEMLNRIDEEIRSNLHQYTKTLEEQRLQILFELTKQIPHFSEKLKEVLLKDSTSQGE